MVPHAGADGSCRRSLSHRLRLRQLAHAPEWSRHLRPLHSIKSFRRRVPPRGGLEQALEFVEHFRYTQDDLDYLATLKPYDPDFLHELGRLRFTGDILAMPEGTVAFAPEPLLRVTAPFREALLLEAGCCTRSAAPRSRDQGVAGRLRRPGPSRGRVLAAAGAEPFVVARSALSPAAYRPRSWKPPAPMGSAHRDRAARLDPGLSDRGSRLRGRWPGRSITTRCCSTPTMFAAGQDRGQGRP